MVKQHIIELNGKHYDTTTGQAVSRQSVSKSVKPKSSAIASKKSLDGFARPAVGAPRRHNPLKGHNVEKSHTLMRRTVHKPSAPKAAASQPKHVRAEILGSSARLKHVRAVPKSKLITKFSDMVSPQSVFSRQKDSEPQAINPSSQAQKLAVAATPITERALAAASSHHQPRLKRPTSHIRLAHRLHISPSVLSGGAFLLAGLLIAGFFTYQNIPNLNMRLASARAGVHGTLPSYKPSGFGMKGGITYQPGQITIGYKSNTDGRNFQIIQAASNWNSESLRENYEALKTSGSRIEVPDKGKTVYIYNGSNATWIDGGIWYRIEGDSKLSSNQLLSLANSL